MAHVDDEGSHSIKKNVNLLKSSSVLHIVLLCICAFKTHIILYISLPLLKINAT